MVRGDRVYQPAHERQVLRPQGADVGARGCRGDGAAVRCPGAPLARLEMRPVVLRGLTSRHTNPFAPRCDPQEGSCFYLGHTLYIWAREVNHRSPRERTVAAATTIPSLWGLEIRPTAAPTPALTWTKHAFGGGPGGMRGLRTVPYGETASAVNPQTSCAYVFGGWHDECDWYDADPSLPPPFTLSLSLTHTHTFHLPLSL